MKQPVEIIAAILLNVVILGALIGFIKIRMNYKRDILRIDRRAEEMCRINDFLFDCLRAQVMNLHYKDYYKQWSRYYKIFRLEQEYYYDSDEPITLDTFFDREQLHSLTQGLN